jgi:hypothetical protein
VKSRMDEIAERAITALFIPDRVVQEAHLRRAWVAFIAIVLVVTIVLAFPPFRDFTARLVLNVDCFSASTKEIGKQYSDFAKVLFQILLVLFISGLIVKDPVSR